MADAHPVLVIIGPSGSGKSTLVEELVRRGLVRVVPTFTTRPPRPAEQGWRVPTHRFVSEQEFDDLCRQGRLAHTGSIDGLPYRYGLPPIVPRGGGPVDAVVLRADHVRQFVDAVPGCVVYEVDAPDPVVADRLRRRGGSPAELSARLRDNTASRQLASSQRVADRRFTNDRSVPDLADAVASAMAIDFPGRHAGSSPAGGVHDRRARRTGTALRAAAIGLAVVVGLCGAYVLAAVAMAVVGMFAGLGSNK
jgi:guanylate kinase